MGNMKVILFDYGVGLRTTLPNTRDSVFNDARMTSQIWNDIVEAESSCNQL